jgi:multiple sugar transport system permease protein
VTFRSGGDRRRARMILILAAIVPLAIELALSVSFLGGDARTARGVALLMRADSTAAALTPGPPAPAVLASAIAELEALGLRALWLPVDANPTGARAEIIREVESRDQSYWRILDGRIAAIAPVKDRDRWDDVGVLVVSSVKPDPARMPVTATIAAFFALAATTLLAVLFLRRPEPMRALVLLLPAAIFAAWIIARSTPGAPAYAGQHGLRATIAFAAWTIPALVGASLARIADRPLVLGQAAKAWAFLAPSFAHLLVFSIGPILFALWLSFHEWNLLQPTRPFVGLDNYRELARDAGFLNAVRNTAIYVLFVPAGMIVSLALALLVNRRLPGVRLLRTVFFLPYVTSFVAISLVWRWMFQPDVGLFNNVLGHVGIPPQPWLSSPASALPSLMFMSIWMYAGYMMVIFLAGLQNIPESLYESARIDGAGAWRRFRHITLPMLRPTILFVLVTMVIFMFQVFTAVYVMTEGGPLHATDVIVYHVYRAAWEYLRMGYASAMAWVLFAVVFVITLLQFRFLGERTGRVVE